MTVRAKNIQLCRFHVEYPSEEEQEVRDRVWDAREQEVSDWFSAGYGAGSKVETVKSHYMLYSMKVMTHCEDCQPLIFLNERCTCTLYGLFSQIWRCIPCTLMKETKCAISEQTTQWIFNDRTRRPKQVSNF